MSTLAGSSPKDHIPHIDGLRAIAALSVLVCHTVSYNPPLLSHMWVRRIALEGAHGIDLFFIISGFCLSYPTLRSLQTNEASVFNTAKFFARRIVRIMPPFLIAALFFGTVAFVFLHIRPGHDLPMGLGAPSPIDVVAQMLFIDRNVHLIVPAFWTLSVEFRWYLVFPLLLTLWVRAPRVFMLVGVAAIIAYNFTRARSIDMGTLPAFMLGIIAAHVYLRQHPIRRYAVPLGLAALAIGIVSQHSASFPGADTGADFKWPYQPTIVGWQFAAFFFVIAAGDIAIVRTLLKQRIPVALGTASYSIYLAHEPILTATMGAFHSRHAVLAAIVALVGGLLFWYVVERPFVSEPLKGRMTGALQGYLTHLIEKLLVPPTFTLRGLRKEPTIFKVVPMVESTASK